jgi:Acyclic terpene utilisation family protein AtuA
MPELSMPEPSMTESSMTGGQATEPPRTGRRPVRIANCSGFYGDRLGAAREMVEGGPAGLGAPIDVLTGDYLAELTMLILWKARQKDPSAGYARTFLTQLEQVLGTCLDRGIKIVSNAGGLNPAGLADEVGKLAAGLGLQPQVAYITGDDLLDRVPGLLAAGVDLAHLDTGQRLADAGVQPVTASAYLGSWGITQALAAGADIVVCPRVTDAALTVGPAAWWHGWGRTDWDQLAGGVIAGHVIECGPQACGGNYPFLAEITDRRYPGFPIAEVRADGSCVITKHDGTGGMVSTGTVTAQLLYEIDGPAYLGPDVVAYFDSVRLTPAGRDRVEISGVRGTRPPDTLKVAMNYRGGYRNTMTLVLTGLDIEEKAAWARAELFGLLGGEERFETVDVRLLRFDQPDAATNEQATAHLRITVRDADQQRAGRAFSDAVLALALGGYAGFHTTTPPTGASEYGVYWPALVPAGVVEQVVVLPDGTRRAVPNTQALTAGQAAAQPAGPPATTPAAPLATAPGATARVPLGLVAGARSGDKGGNANVGLWARDDAAYAWLASWLTIERFHELLPESAGLALRRYELPNLRALNFVVVGLLGDGVAASTRPDPQAKGLGEYLRSRFADIPVELLGPEAANAAQPDGARVGDDRAASDPETASDEHR